MYVCICSAVAMGWLEPILENKSCILNVRLGSHRTDASSLCTQLCISSPLLRQSKSIASVPVHPTLSKMIGPVPSPNCAEPKATASVIGNTTSERSCHVECSMWRVPCGGLHVVTCMYGHTESRVSKLSTGDCSIICSPTVIAHSAPCLVVAHLYTAFKGTGASTSKSDISL